MYYHGYVGVCSNEHFLIAFTIVIFYAIHNPQHKIVLHIFLIGILVTIVLFVLDRIALQELYSVFKKAESEGYGKLLPSGGVDILPVIVRKQFFMLPLVLIIYVLLFILPWVRDKNKQECFAADRHCLEIYTLEPFKYNTSFILLSGLVYLVLSSVLYNMHYNILFGNVRFIIFFLLTLVAFLKGTRTATILRVLLLGIAIEIFFTVADCNRMALIKESLEKVNIEYNIDPLIFASIAPEPTRSIIEEPAFHGNLLAQWLHPQENTLVISYFALIVPLLIFVCAIYRYSQFRGNSGGNSRTDHGLILGQTTN